MSQYFLNLIKRGETAAVAASAEEDRSVVVCKDAQGVSALLWAVYCRQPLIRDYLLNQIAELAIELDIFEACAVGDRSSAESLLRGDATRVHQYSADGWAPLHLAAAFGGAEVTALLLEHGAHVHQVSRNPMRNQPLHACIGLSEDQETAKLLIAQGADVNFPQAGGYTPLHQAAAAGKLEMVLLLLEAGADPASVCDQGKTPAGYARERGHHALAEVLPVHVKS